MIFFQIVLFFQVLRCYIETDDSIPIPAELLHFLIKEYSNYPILESVLLAHFEENAIPMSRYTNFSFLWEERNGVRVQININDIAIDAIIEYKSSREFDARDLKKYYQLYAHWWYSQLDYSEQLFNQEFLDFISEITFEQMNSIYNRPLYESDEDEDDDNEDDDNEDDEYDEDDKDDEDDERHVRQRIE